ncbi:MAG TPA: DUF4159 domain-containing protein [Bryobacteraceae bacterium]|jgi:hypothetical protein|nr:DUF4159 domain-containing protein [Bryobacteraceae bacterium]
MRVRSVFLLVVAGFATWGVLRAQRPFQQYQTAEEHAEYSIPSDAYETHEWTRARLAYPSIMAPHGYPDGYKRWTIDYPRSDRLLLKGIKRLTRIDARSVEQVVFLDGSDDVYNWPLMYAVEVGYWNLTDEMAAQLREYLLRGGFFMCDDFHGTIEWENFMNSMRKVFPDRPVVDIDNKDPIFHVIYDLDDRFQVAGAQYLMTGRRYEYDGYEAKWRGIYDDKGRLMVVICHNMDLGDAWEWSDDPRYPEKWASLAYRIACNYFMYDLSH